MIDRINLRMKADDTFTLCKSGSMKAISAWNPERFSELTGTWKLRLVPVLPELVRLKKNPPSKYRLAGRRN